MWSYVVYSFDRIKGDDTLEAVGALIDRLYHSLIGGRNTIFAKNVFQCLLV